MSDLFSPLRTPGAEPLPATPAEIRQRGDRARRRRSALVAGGAALAVAAVASGALLLGPDGSADPQPAPAPTRTDAPESPDAPETSDTPVVPDTIPADFPLAVGMIEDPDEANADPWLGDIDYCDASSSMADTAVDDRFAQTLVPGDNQFRSLELFASAREAKARALDHVGKFRSCPQFTTEVGSVARTEVGESGLGDQGWTVTRDFTSNGKPQFGQEVYQVVRSGNALLITRRSNEGPGSTDPERFRLFALHDTESVMDLVGAMCPWSEEGCVGG